MPRLWHDADCTDRTKAADKLDEVPQEKWRGDNFIVKDPEAEEDALEIVETKVGDAKVDW
jgi:hypothetical protein